MAVGKIDVNTEDERFENCFRVPSEMDSAIWGTFITLSSVALLVYILRLDERWVYNHNAAGWV